MFGVKTLTLQKKKLDEKSLCHDEKCNNILDICCGLTTWADVSSSVVIGATTLPVAVIQVFLHLAVCFGFNGLMHKQGFILLHVVN